MQTVTAGFAITQVRWVLIFVTLLVQGCALFKPPAPGIGKPIEFTDLQGWNEDQHQLAWPAFLQSCRKLDKQPTWMPVCRAARQLLDPDQAEVRLFFETWTQPHQIYASRGKTQGLITGYYEPMLRGSMTRQGPYQYPLYRRPTELLQIDLGPRFPELKNQRLRGRVVGNKVVPFWSREQIERDRELLTGNELLWLDSRDDAFFLHIQGSGKVTLDDGSVVGVGYADQNGHAYRAIGKILVDREEMSLEDVTLFSLRQWLRDNPDQAEEVLNQNPSYVFFVMREEPESGPIGSLNVPLTAGRSIAIDPGVIDLGIPVWLSTHFPGQPDLPLSRLMLAQDTGGAIKGYVRADVFWGSDALAEQYAGTMKSTGSLYVLLPRGIAQ